MSTELELKNKLLNEVKDESEATLKNMSESQQNLKDANKRKSSRCKCLIGLIVTVLLVVVGCIV